MAFAMPCCNLASEAKGCAHATGVKSRRLEEPVAIEGLSRGMSHGDLLAPCAAARLIQILDREVHLLRGHAGDGWIGTSEVNVWSHQKRNRTPEEPERMR